ncbi:ParB N-terminal domain-containing protein [uncultured Tateyamaria sp.]|uniref:ParB/RepB/Spo0J family partition protein n=1 Tax=uncultured Tateyamaria sp. TaxID=455651 RepID=UPI00260AC77E|nr:ParB N-terminal domain-containing protein [uncultured Tateyamaria sp.]
MAKRKRLSPAPAFEIPDPLAGSGPGLETKAMNGWVGTRAPIADVAGDTARHAAFEEVSAELQSARAEGRMVLRLPLDVIEADHLVRDRVAVDGDEMDSLMDSLRDRGQQTPVEVVELSGGRYGLISGWRRLMALQALQGEAPDEPRFATIQALVRAPDSAPDAYRAMVEENELRANLSFYERARIAVKAAEEGVYDSPKHAVQSLFSSVRRAKRSKILSFTDLVVLDDHLSFPTAIPEKLGLALVAEMRSTPGFAQGLIRTLDQAAPVAGSAEERKVLEQSLRSPGKDTQGTPKEQLAEGLELRGQAGKVTLAGPRVDAALMADLRAWLLDRL